MKASLKKLLCIELVFICLALIFGTFFIRAIPPFWGLDEPEHFQRAFQISEGKLGVYKIMGGSYGGRVPTAAYRLGLNAKYDLIDNAMDKPQFQRSDFNANYPYKELGSQSINGPKSQESFPNSAVYSPLGYLPAATGIGVGKALNLSITHTLYLARLLGLIVFIAITTLAIRIANKKQKWLIFAVALLPVCLFQAAVLSNDIALNALSLLLFAQVARKFGSDNGAQIFTRVEIIGIAATIFLIAATKPNYAILFLVLIFLPPTLFKSQKVTYIAKMTWSIAGVLPAAIWGLVSEPVGNFIGQLRGAEAALYINPAEQLKYILDEPFRYIGVVARTFWQYGDQFLSSMLGLLGWNYVQLPWFALSLAALIIIVAAIYSRSYILKKYYGISLVLSSLITILGILTTLYITFSRVGEATIAGFQGRYLLPFIPLVAFGVASILPSDLQLKKDNQVRLFLVTATTSNLIVALTMYLVTTY